MSSNSPASASASAMPATASFSEQRVRVIWPYYDCKLISLERLEQESLVELEVTRKLLRVISVGETLALGGLGLRCNCSVVTMLELSHDNVRIVVRALDCHVHPCYECEFRDKDEVIPVGSFSDRMVGKAMRFCGSVPEIVSEAVVQDVKRKDSLLCVVHLEFLSALPLHMGDLLVLESMDGQRQWEAHVACFGDSTFLVGGTEYVIVHVHDGHDIDLKMLPPFKCVTVEPASSSTSIPTDNRSEAASDRTNKTTLSKAENRAKAKIKIGINGYGSFGRTVAKIALDSQDVELVAINEPFSMMDQMTCLFRDKKIHGQWLRSDFKMKDPNTLIFGEKEVTLFRIEEDNEIPWNMTGAEYIIAAYCAKSGFDFYKARTSKYNHYSSNANIFGNRLSPLAKILHDRFGTIENLSVDWRVPILNIELRNNHAAKAVEEVLPQWKGVQSGLIFKVGAVDIAIELVQYNDYGLLLSSTKPSFGFSTLLCWCVEMIRQIPEVIYCELKFK